MKSAGRPISAALRGRRYVAQAAAAQSKVALPREDVQVSRLPNGALVASVENHSPVSRLAVFYNAGSRFETGNNVGIVHCIRNLSDQSANKITRFGMIRSVEQHGANLSCSATREHLIYSMTCLRSNFDECVGILGDVATSPAFNFWEMPDARYRMEFEQALLQTQPHVQLMEALHKAAYKTTLGNSLYMPPFKMGTYTPELLHSFTDQYFVSGNAAVVGVGINHEQLVTHAKKMRFASGSAPAKQAASYGGGELFVEGPGDLVHAAIATEGRDLGSNDLLSLAVLQKVLGPQPSLKYSNNVASSKANKAAGQGTSHPYAASCLNACYSDSGLFGFQVVAQSADVGKVLKSVVDAFANATKDGGISDADVSRAKAQLKAASHMELEDSGLVLEDLGVQTLLAGQVLNTEDVDAAIDKISTADVQAVAKKVINGKPCMAAVGNTHDTPRLNQLL